MVFELLGHLAGHGGAANLRGGVGAVGTHGTHALNLVGSGNEVHDRCYCPNSETRNHGSGLVRRRPGAAACGGWARERSSGARCSWSEMGVARGAGCTAAGGGSWIGLVCALSIILSLQSIPLTPPPPLPRSVTGPGGSEGAHGTAVWSKDYTLSSATVDPRLRPTCQHLAITGAAPPPQSSHPSPCPLTACTHTPYHHARTPLLRTSRV